MARRSDHTPEELKELAIAKAIDIIDKNGTNGFSARGVAKAMGYTVGTLYHTFGSYDMLLFHVNGRILDEWHEGLKRGIEKKAPGSRLSYLADAYINYARTHYNRWTSLFEFQSDKIPIPDWYREKVDRLFLLIESTLQPYTKGSKKSHLSAQVLWASIHGICVLSLSGKLDSINAESTEVLVSDLLKTYLRGL